MTDDERMRESLCAELRLLEGLLARPVRSTPLSEDDLRRDFDLTARGPILTAYEALHRDGLVEACHCVRDGVNYVGRRLVSREDALERVLSLRERLQAIDRRSRLGALAG